LPLLIWRAASALNNFVAWRFTMYQTNNINPDYKQDL
jgi:hypothetical protein